MTKYFINAGANHGNDIRKFRRLYDDHNEWNIIALEPLPECIESLKTADDLGEFELIEKAVSTNDSTINFYTGQTDLSGSIRKDKTSWMSGDKIQVESMNFSKWIQNRFSKDDYIILSLDIEGAEYDVLEAMLESNTIDLVDELYVEYHTKKIANISRQRERTLRSTLIEKFGDNIYEWKGHNSDKFDLLNCDIQQQEEEHVST